MRNRKIFTAYFATYKKEMPPPRGCDHACCTEAGIFRAPKSPQQLYEYWWFCLPHVRHYNKQWNYYEGMSESQIEWSIRQDTVWEKPSWPLRGNPFTRINQRFQFFDEENEPYSSQEKPPADERPTHIIIEERKALQLLNLAPPASFQDIKKQYKHLAKQHHPDLNSGDNGAEERLKEINRAYQFLKTHAVDAQRNDKAS